ncbi:MAG: hypothetical protein FWC05_02270 [Treponema sp.]|nr:hypothetical protein [Treponema sp.]
MKIFQVLFAAIAVMALVLGCGSGPSATRQNAPEWLNELPPQDVFWGIGFAKLQNENLARETAMSRARRDVAAQLSSLVQSMLTDYAKESGTLGNTASIQSIERVSQELINVNLAGASPNAQVRMDDGTWWVRVSFAKPDAQRVINDVFATEASRYADFKANEASRMMHDRINQTQSRPTPRSED